MSATPRVTCIMIFRDAERFMAEAIESVLAQTEESWELLLVDDGSVDGSTALARDFAARHPDRMRHLEHPGHENRGMSSSRNLGLAHARGELIAFLDADDVWLPHKLAVQTAILDTHPDVDLVYGPSEYWYGWSGDPADVARDHFGDLGVAPETTYPAPRLLAHALGNGGATMPGICSLLIRRPAIERVGGFEEAFRGCYEDQVLLFKLFLRATVYVTAVCSDRYRQHPWSACAQASRSGEYHPALPHRARRIFLEWLRWYLDAEGVFDPTIRGPLRENLLPYDHPIRHGSLVRARWAMQRVRRHVVAALRATLPPELYRWLRARRHAGEWVPPVGLVRFGSLRRLAPMQGAGRAERGVPIDRHYVAGALAEHGAALQGDVLEVGSDELATRARRTGITCYTQIGLDDGAAARLAGLPDGRFDGIVCAHALQRVFDVRETLREMQRLLKPGGVLLVTVPGAGSIGAPAADATYWGFTALSIRALFEAVFPAAALHVETRGSILTATAHLNGIAAGELRPHELAHRDADYPVVLVVRAVKACGAGEVVGAGGGAPAVGSDENVMRRALAFLDGYGDIAAWGPAAAGAAAFASKSAYRVGGVPPVDGTRAGADGLLLGHVLEHDPEWASTLDAALRAFRRRMVVVIGTPFATVTHEIGSQGGVPELAFRREDLVARFGEALVGEESVETATRYGREHVFYLERRVHLRAIA